MLFSVIAVSEVPVISPLGVVPVRVPIVVDVFSAILFLANLRGVGREGESQGCEGSTESEFMLDEHFHLFGIYNIRIISMI